MAAEATSAPQIHVGFMGHVRHSVIVALILATAAAAATAAEKVTIVLEFQDGYSAQSVSAMKREVEKAFQDAHLRVDWRSREEAVGGVFGDMAVIRFRGKCLFQPGVVAAREPEALAVTHISDGVVLPFSDVACDRIAVLLHTAIRGTGAARADALFGRAMGRVVAHELVHILSRSVAHGATGVVEPALSAGQLTSDALVLGWRGPIQSAYAGDRSSITR
jgi:hypothetical protein